MELSRRQFMIAMASAATAAAEEMWVPGKKLISIPSGKIFTGNKFKYDQNGNIKWIGAEDGLATVVEFHDWLREQAMAKPTLAVTFQDRSRQNTFSKCTVSLKEGVRMLNPEHLIQGTIFQDSTREGDREVWTHWGDFSGEDEFVVDKVYTHEESEPQKRVHKSEHGFEMYR
jgi:hypothetical protein